jgi:8-oxo-dGTP pyrophosphatase MutT (NUDIX family)
MTTTVPIPAATLVLMRPRVGAPPEVLMVERASRMAFAAGAMVFPGGRVDPGDRVMAARSGAADLDPDDAAARIAAIRETIEEVGVAAGILPVPGADEIAQVRAALSAGLSFIEVAADHRWTLDLDALVPFARWRPNFAERRTFDTRFYAISVPADTLAIADGTECVRAAWMGAQDALDHADRGSSRLIFPTRRNLERIAVHASYAAFVADAATRAIPTITPRIERRDGADWLCIPDHLGYPVTAEPLETARRA